MKCPECEGTGSIAVLYYEVSGSGVGMSSESAMSKAGEVHHYEECLECDGTGELSEDGEV